MAEEAKREIAGDEDPAEFDYSEAGHHRRQARRGLSLTPAQRLRWLEETMEELRGWVGRASLGRPIDPDRQ